MTETRCDTFDNDCDTAIDEGQPNLGDACADGGIGVCQGTGTFICDPADLDGAALCNITAPGTTPSAEACDGKDNNCDGTIDNTTGPDRVIDSMTQIGSGMTAYWIDTYEASRPDATAASSGLGTSRACSDPGVMPWRNVSYDAAVAACTAAGKVLCTGVQWQTACEGTMNTTYPYGNTFGPSTCNTESNDGIAGGTDDDILLVTGAKTACLGGAGRPLDMSGNLKEWTNDITGTTTGGDPIAVLRGGAYDTPAVGATCDFRLTRSGSDVLEVTNGFRCCRPTAP